MSDNNENESAQRISEPLAISNDTQNITMEPLVIATEVAPLPTEQLEITTEAAPLPTEQLEITTEAAHLPAEPLVLSLPDNVPELHEKKENEIVIEEPQIKSVPKLIFLVPYRDRVQQQQFFSAHMNVILEDIPKQDYEIYYVHQVDNREFNRGAMKNIGFLAMKEKYPTDYQNMTFVFNDVDTMPFSKNFLNYYTVSGVVKHFYGYTFALGGIVSILGSDFEKTMGYPNFWTWGYEDNLLQKRVQQAGLQIDRSQFYPIMDKNIFQMKDGITRIVNRGEFERFVADTTEGWQSITGLQYSIDESSKFINVTAFDTGFQEKKELTRLHDLRNGSRPFQPTNLMSMNSGRGRAKPKMSMRL
jgi:N-terminal region of glycosyl transferase group 7